MLYALCTGRALRRRHPLVELFPPRSNGTSPCPRRRWRWRPPRAGAGRPPLPAQGSRRALRRRGGAGPRSRALRRAGVAAGALPARRRHRRRRDPAAAAAFINPARRLPAAADPGPHSSSLGGPRRLPGRPRGAARRGVHDRPRAGGRARSPPRRRARADRRHGDVRRIRDGAGALLKAEQLRSLGVSATARSSTRWSRSRSASPRTGPSPSDAWPRCWRDPRRPGLAPSRGAAANFDDFDEAARDEERALAVDPGRRGVEIPGASLAYPAAADAQRAVEQCLARNPGAERCLGMLARPGRARLATRWRPPPGR